MLELQAVADFTEERLHEIPPDRLEVSDLLQNAGLMFGKDGAPANLDLSVQLVRVDLDQFKATESVELPRVMPALSFAVEHFAPEVHGMAVGLLDSGHA